MKRNLYIGLSLSVGLILFAMAPENLELPTRIFWYGIFPPQILLTLALGLCAASEKINEWFD